MPYSQTDNSLYQRLRKKAERLSSTKFAGMRGIILGDGNCYALQRTAGGSGTSYHTRDIVRTFFKTHPSITFATISHYEHEMSFSTRGHWLRHTVYFQRGSPTRNKRNCCTSSTIYLVRFRVQFNLRTMLFAMSLADESCRAVAH